LAPPSCKKSSQTKQSQSFVFQTNIAAPEAIMTTTIAYPHIVKENGSAACLESHPRTRVALIVMDYIARGLGPEEIVRHYPYLNLAEVHAAMGYYHDHQDEIDAEIQAELDQLQQVSTKPRSPIWLKLKAKGLI
jgi:uncharacterized protein (DUF433 family)